MKLVRARLLNARRALISRIAIIKMIVAISVRHPAKTLVSLLRAPHIQWVVQRVYLDRSVQGAPIIVPGIHMDIRVRIPVRLQRPDVRHAVVQKVNVMRKVTCVITDP